MRKTKVTLSNYTQNQSMRFLPVEKALQNLLQEVEQKGFIQNHSFYDEYEVYKSSGERHYFKIDISYSLKGYNIHIDYCIDVI